MPQLDWNKATWDGMYDWAELGEELTKQIGGKEVFIVPDFARVPEKDKYLPAYANFTDKAVELGLLPTMACVNEEFRNKVMRFSK